MAMNPFLFEADYGGGVGATAEPSAAAAAAANPFLSDFGGGGEATSAVPDFGSGVSMTAAVPAAEVNPFLSYQPPPEPSYATHDSVAMAPAPAPAAAASNPFANFVDASMDTAPAMNSTGAAMFGTAAPAINHGASLFGGVEPTPTVAVETLLDISDPVRPPPASVPSSTQDLLDTVTGALEATSDSLLDRLRASQPSPVPQMIQPSPSPRSPSPDLMMGDEPPPVPPSSANPLAPSPGMNQVDSIMDLFDSPMPSGGPKSSLEILGLYNSTTSATTTASAPPKAEQLLDLLDSVPAAPTETTTKMEVDTKVDALQYSQKAPEAMAEDKPPDEPQQTVAVDLGSQPAPEPEKMAEEEIVTAPPPPPTEEPPPVVEQVKPQPMRPPPPPPAAKAAPPERPKPPPVPQQPVAPPAPTPPPPPVAPQPEAISEPPPPPPPVAAPPVAAAPPVEHKSPLPSRPPPPVPPPKAPPQPQPVEPAPPPKSKSPSPPTVASITTTPSPTKPAPVPAQPVAVPPAPAPAPAPVPPPVAAPAPVAAPIFEQSTTTTSNGLPSSGAGIFGTPSSSPFVTTEYSTTGGRDAFSSVPKVVESKPKPVFAAATAGMGDSFDAFEAKFSRAVNASSNAFGDAFGSATNTSSSDVNSGNTEYSAWGDNGDNGGGGGGGFGASDANDGFGNESGFDSFLSLTEPPPVPQSTPAKRSTAGDDDDDFDAEEKDMAIVIKPKADKDFSLTLAPALAPPPKSPAMSTGSAFSDENTAYVPFLSSAKDSSKPPAAGATTTTTMHKSDSQDSPQTPLYEEDQSQPLEDFPRITYTGEGWEMFMRLPNKKKITGQRFWKKCFVKVGYQNDIPVVQIYNQKGEKDPFQEIPLQPCYSVSEISAQQFDQYGKVFTLKLQYIFYKERPGIRPGQIGKASRISDKLTQFAAYAIQGDYAGVKEFGSDLKKLGAPIEHSPQISQLVKLGIGSYEDIRQFSIWIEENLFRMSVHRDRTMNYKTEEIQVTIVDEYYVEQDIYGVVQRQIARVRLFFLSFLNGSAEIEMGVNDLRRQGKEIVGRHDIIPVPTEEWIRMEAIELSNCVHVDEFDKTQTIRFKPPDACYIELMRFRVRPPRHRELPLQVKTVFTTLGQRIEIRSDILVPGFTSRKLGQIPCEDVMVRFPIPEEWIYMFRVEKHFRYGSVKSAHRRSGKVKGIERFLGAVDAVEQSLMETTSGQAKYEHHHKAIVWRIPRLPKEGQGAYTTHSFFCHITLQAHERVPDNLSKHCYVEFTMPHTTISHTVCRSISVPSCDEPPEKCCRYLSRHEYTVEIEHSEGFTPTTYTVAAATTKKEEPPPEEKEVPMPGKAESDSDFSDD